MQITFRQAILAQNTINENLINLDSLTMAESVALARLGWEIDREVAVFRQLRDQFIKEYQIKIKIGDKEGTTIAETGLSDKESALLAFDQKINELAEVLTGDITVKIHLPKDLKGVEPAKLKPIAPFIADE